MSIGVKVNNLKNLLINNWDKLTIKKFIKLGPQLKQADRCKEIYR